MPKSIRLSKRVAPDGAIRILSDRVDARRFDDGKRKTVVHLARVTTLRDPFYGKLELTEDMFRQMIRNFEDGTYGQKIYLDLSHRPDLGSAGEFKRLFLDGNKFRGEVEFTDLGIEAVRKRRMEYLSMDYTEEYTDPETDQEHGAVLFGAALTTRPRLKRLEPVQLSEDATGRQLFVSPRIEKLLHEEHATMLKDLLKKLRKRLSELELHDSVIKQLCESFEVVGAKIADEDALKAVAEQYEAQAKLLAEQSGGQAVQLSIQVPEIKAGVSPEDVERVSPAHAGIDLESRWAHPPGKRAAAPR